jgi:cyclopropane fatty-acyl-phospholipid synthase-like methyltransferase
VRKHLFNPFQFFRRRSFAKRCIDEICLFSGKPKSEVKRKFYNFNLTSEEWAKAEHKSDNDMLQFFAQTDAYIYASLRYIATAQAKYESLSSLLKFCQKHDVHSALDYGAGAGQYCIVLAQHGIDVTCAEVYGKLWQFCEWRFKQKNLPIKMLRCEIDPLEKYDLIVCADVLPLVGNPPLLVKTLYDALNTRGYLCLIYNFKETPGKPQNTNNLKYADNFDNILSEIGLKYITQNYFQYFQK